MTNEMHLPFVFLVSPMTFFKRTI